MKQNKTHTAGLAISAGVFLATAATVSAAVTTTPFTDEFNDTTNVHNRTPSNVTVVSSGGRLVNTWVGSGAGFTNVDFYVDAQSVAAIGFSAASNTFSLATLPTFIIRDAQPIGDGQFSTGVFFFDAADAFGGETGLEFDNAIAGDHTYDVAAAAAAAGFPTATAYAFRYSIIADPNNGAAVDGFSFASFEAVPEPTSAVFLGNSR